MDCRWLAQLADDGSFCNVAETAELAFVLLTKLGVTALHFPLLVVTCRSVTTVTAPTRRCVDLWSWQVCLWQIFPGILAPIMLGIVAALSCLDYGVHLGASPLASKIAFPLLVCSGFGVP